MVAVGGDERWLNHEGRVFTNEFIARILRRHQMPAFFCRMKTQYACHEPGNKAHSEAGPVGTSILASGTMRKILMIS